MRTIKIKFKPGTWLGEATRVMMNISSRVVILDRYTFMMEIGVTDLHQVESIRAMKDVDKVELYQDDSGTIEGLLGRVY